MPTGPRQRTPSTRRTDRSHPSAGHGEARVRARPFDSDTHLHERIRALAERCEYLEGERDRLQSLLAQALLVAVGGTTVQPLAILDVICDIIGTNPARPYVVERRERAAAESADGSSRVRTHVVYDDQGNVVEYELRSSEPGRPLAKDELDAVVGVLRETAT